MWRNAFSSILDEWVREGEMEKERETKRILPSLDNVQVHTLPQCRVIMGYRAEFFTLWKVFWLCVFNEKFNYLTPDGPKPKSNLKRMGVLRLSEQYKNHNLILWPGEDRVDNLWVSVVCSYSFGHSTLLEQGEARQAVMVFDMLQLTCLFLSSSSQEQVCLMS